MDSRPATPETRPNPHIFAKESIPEALTTEESWILWHGEWEEDDKLSKLPYQISGRFAKSTDPDTWTTFDRAADYAAKFNDRYGIGYVFNPESDLGGVDLDHCLDPETADIKPWAQEIIDSANTYAEISPSGTGVKLLGRFKLPTMSGHKKVLNEETGEAVEVYDRGRFFTITGNRLPGTAAEPRNLQLAVEGILSKYFAKPVVVRKQEYRTPQQRDLTGEEKAALIKGIADNLPSHELHYLAMDLSGYLGRRTDEETVGDILVAAWDANGRIKADGQGLRKIVRDTFENLADPEKDVTGGPSIEKRSPEMWKAISAVFAEDTPAEETSEGYTDRRNQADRLIQYALDSGAELFVDHLGEPHALITGTQAVALNSRAYPWLRRMMWDKEKKTVTGESLKTAAETLAAFALASENVRTLYTRSAFHEGKVYYWLGPERVAEIDAEGWRVRDHAPVLFRTIPNLRELPNPSAKGSWDGLEALVNLKEERDKRLFRAHLVTLPLEHIPRPIFQPTGVMGSGKSTVCRAIKRLLDPTAPESVRIDPRDFLQKASHSYVVMLDNQNSLPEWAVDTLCRLVTGEADSKRKHYTNDEDFIYELKRAVLLNGINAPTDRGDAQDRTLPVELDRIPDHIRRDEEALWTLFEDEHPHLLGAIFDALSETLHARPRVKLSKRPRLADWGYYAAAVYEASGWGSERFIEDWAGVVTAQNQETLDGSAVAQCIISIMEEHTEFVAKPERMLEVLETEAEKLKINTKKDKSFPGSPRWVYRRIKEVIPLLNAVGILVDRDRDGKQREIRLFKPGGGPPTGGGGDDIRSDSNVTDRGLMSSNVTSNVTAKAAEVSQKDENEPSDDISDIRSGGISPSLTKKVEEDVEATEEGESDTPRGLPRNNVTDVTPAMGYEPPDRDYSDLDYDPDDFMLLNDPRRFEKEAPECVHLSEGGCTECQEYKDCVGKFPETEEELWRWQADGTMPWEE